MSIQEVTWVLQENAIGRRDLDAISGHLEEIGVRVECVRVIPFSHEPADPIPSIDGPCVVYGSSGLLSLARRIGWTPGGWDGPAFSASSVLGAFGALALNAEAVVTRWSDVARRARERDWSTVFVRPDAETKEFAGAVYEADELERFVSRLHSAGYLDREDATALIAPVRELGSEWRAFVVDRRVVSISRYSVGGESNLAEGAPSTVIEFVETCIERYAPAPCFVIDVAEALDLDESALRVIELNSINSAGFYASDKAAILTAVSDLVSRERLRST